MTPTYWANEKKLTPNWVGDAETQFCCKPQHGTVTHSQVETQNPELLPEEQRA